MKITTFKKALSLDEQVKDGKIGRECKNTVKDAMICSLWAASLINLQYYYGLIKLWMFNVYYRDQRIIKQIIKLNIKHAKG